MNALLIDELAMTYYIQTFNIYPEGLMKYVISYVMKLFNVVI